MMKMNGTEGVPPVPEDGDAVFAAELNKLSIKERDSALHDVHGVSDVIREDPYFVRKCFQDLQLEILKIREKAAYDLALQKDESYVNDERLRLMFLRAESFDPTTAATRMVSFFEAKLDLFGPESIARDIRMSDLDEDDKRCLESGYVQLLSGRDRAGRAIFLLLPMIKAHKTHVNKVRSFLPGHYVPFSGSSDLM